MFCDFEEMKKLVCMCMMKFQCLWYLNAICLTIQLILPN